MQVVLLMILAEFLLLREPATPELFWMMKVFAGAPYVLFLIFVYKKTSEQHDGWKQVINDCPGSVMLIFLGFIVLSAVSMACLLFSFTWRFHLCGFFEKVSGLIGYLIVFWYCLIESKNKKEGRPERAVGVSPKAAMDALNGHS